MHLKSIANRRAVLQHTSNSDLKYGLQADKTILCALHVCPSHASVTSVKLFSSRRCLNDETILDWKSFHFKKNCCCSADMVLTEQNKIKLYITQNTTRRHIRNQNVIYPVNIKYVQTRLKTHIQFLKRVFLAIKFY